MDEMDDTELGRATEVFKAAGHPARLRILAMLRGGGLCVCQVTAVLDLAVSTVSAHLAELNERASCSNARRAAGSSTAWPRTLGRRPCCASVWTRVGNDPQIEADGRLVRGLRRVPVEDLCRAGLDVTRRRLSARRRS